MALYENNIKLKGYIGKDAENFATKQQKTFTVLSLATKSGYKDKQKDEWVNHTEWHRIVAFGKPAEHAKNLKKGDYAEIEGDDAVPLGVVHPLARLLVLVAGLGGQRQDREGILLFGCEALGVLADVALQRDFVFVVCHCFSPVCICPDCSRDTLARSDASVPRSQVPKACLSAEAPRKKSRPTGPKPQGDFFFGNPDPKGARQGEAERRVPPGAGEAPSE